MKIAIYNDCFATEYKHFGCELVMETFRDQLNRVDCELVGTVKKDEFKDDSLVSRILGKADLVIVNGEGSFHNNRRNDILRIGEKYPSILVNTVFQNNKTNRLLENFKYISCRESLSASECGRELGKKVDVVPDIIFTNKRIAKMKFNPKKDIIKVRHGSNLNTKNSAEYFMNELSQYRSVSSVSYHALIISIILGQDIKEVVASNTHKNESLMNDFLRDSEYVANSRNKVNNLFESLHSIL